MLFVLQVTKAVRRLGNEATKEVAYREISGTPGLLFRRGNTRHSYERLPVVPSPIASQTKLLSTVLVIFEFLLYVVSLACCLWDET